MSQLNKLLTALVVGVMLSSLVYAGMTNFDSLTLTPESSGDNALVVNNSGGSAKFTIDGSGDVTASGTLALSGAQTITADMTFDGAGIDILTETDNETDLFTEAKSGAGAFLTTLDVDTSINCDGSLVVDTTSTLTGAVALDGGATLANTKDLLVGTDGGSDIGASGTQVGTLYVDNLSSSTTMTAATTMTFAKNVVHEVMDTIIAAAGPTNISERYTSAHGGSANVVLNLPDATTASGQVFRIIWGDTTTNDVDILTNGGTIGITDPAAAGVAAGTGVTPAADDGWAEWQSDGTNWVFLGGDVVASN